jgi:hypothetical protein
MFAKQTEEVVGLACVEITFFFKGWGETPQL